MNNNDSIAIQYWLIFALNKFVSFYIIWLNQNFRLPIQNNNACLKITKILNFKFFKNLSYYLLNTTLYSHMICIALSDCRGSIRKPQINSNGKRRTDKMYGLSYNVNLNRILIDWRRFFRIDLIFAGCCLLVNALLIQLYILCDAAISILIIYRSLWRFKVGRVLQLNLIS